LDVLLFASEEVDELATRVESFCVNVEDRLVTDELLNIVDELWAMYGTCIDLCERILSLRDDGTVLFPTRQAAEEALAKVGGTLKAVGGDAA
jgi:hypothetical protein